MKRFVASKSFVPLGLALLAAILPISGCAEPTERAAAKDGAVPEAAPRNASDAGPANLVLITLDTTGADELGSYGHEEASTPNLDRIAEEGLRVERSVAVTPITLPSHASILTGLYPPRHGVRDNSDFRLPPDALTLAEHLEEQGYSTAAVVAAYVLSSDFGIGQGFDRYDEPRSDRLITPQAKELEHRPILQRPAAEVTDQALEFLDSGLGEPFFLWAHYYDPHAEYEPPEPFASRFADRPYDGEIAYMDREIGRLVADLRRRGLLDDTLLVVTGDHGESLDEHGENTHGLFVYDATQRVPLILRFPPAIPAGLTTDRLVSGVDLAPTILELLGLPPMDGVEGVSFAPVVRGETMPERPAVYAEAKLPERSYGWSPLLALSDRRHKFIEAPRPELYDLRSDPDELENLADERPQEVAQWRARLAALEEAWPVPDVAAERPISDAEREHLMSLGYLSSETEVPAGPKTEDPKDLVHLHNLLRGVKVLLQRDEVERATGVLETVLKEDPDNPAALTLIGTILSSRDRYDQGIELLKAAVRRSPTLVEAQHNLANALFLGGRLEEAAEAYRRVIELQPFSAEDHYALGNVLFAMQQPGEAIGAYRRALELGAEESAPLHAALGVALAASGDVEGGRASLRRATEIDPGLTDAWNALGNFAEREGRIADAARFYETALDTDPRHPGALFNNARLAIGTGDLPAAKQHVEALLEHHPAMPQGRLLESQLHLAEGNPAAARESLESLLALPNVDPRLAAHARDLLGRLGG